jgi:outer membrane protein assembly factor BamA
MKTLCLAVALAIPLAGCGVPDDEEQKTLNVNSRYTVESVHVMGQLSVDISDPLRLDLDKVVGEKFDRTALEKLADRLKHELHGAHVDLKVTRGTDPDHVIVNFEVKQSFDLKLAKFVYNSKEGWTGDGSVIANTKGNTLTFGMLSDGDTEIERFAGIRAAFERKHVGTDRLQLRFEFDDYHQQWNSATLAAASPSEIYQSRQVYTPEATVIIAKPLEFSFGVSFARLRVPYPNGGAAAANTESSNAVVNTLRYHQRWGSAKEDIQQEAAASYSLTAATNVLGSDKVFNRHEAKARYKFRHGRQEVAVAFLAGLIHGDAPLYERFVLGNSETLRGWNKFALDPLGGSHVIHASIDYAYRVLQVFYDNGAIWTAPQDREQKQSVGVGLKKDCFQLAVAFPLRAGHIDPIFYAGMNF